MMDRRIDRAKGFGLIELMITLVIASLLLSIAVPAYDRYVDRAKEARAIGDIGAISIEIGKFQLRNNNALPDTLGELGIDIPLDPWDVPYEYLNIVLYSSGEDKNSKGPLSAKESRDDIIRANNGAFIGLAEDY